VRIHNILCPVDFSDPSREALHFACDMARQFEADLVLLNVYQVPGYALPEGVVVATPEVLNEMVTSIEKELDRWAEEARALGVQDVRTRTELGIAHTEINRVAREAGFDLIVIGTHGRTGLKHVLLGSVAERVVRTAPCPVLTVRSSVTHAHHAEEGTQTP
jgi:nucleotide-binding universal stress UspA family protein